MKKLITTIFLILIVNSAQAESNLQKILSKGELRVLENVGHGSVLQRPDLTVKYFLEWHKKILGA